MEDEAIPMSGLMTGNLVRTLVPYNVAFRGKPYDEDASPEAIGFAPMQTSLPVTW